MDKQFNSIKGKWVKVKDPWLQSATSSYLNRCQTDIKEIIPMQTMVPGDMMNSSKIKSVKLLKLPLLISMLPQLWSEHRTTETILPVVTKLLIQVISVVFQIWLLCLNHIVMLVKMLMAKLQETKLEYMTNWGTLTKAQISILAVKWWVLAFTINNLPKLVVKEELNN